MKFQTFVNNHCNQNFDELEKVRPRGLEDHRCIMASITLTVQWVRNVANFGIPLSQGQAWLQIDRFVTNIPSM